MNATPLVRLLAGALLLGTALLAVAALVHPVLAGDSAAQLSLIGTTSYWRALHLVMLGASGLVIAGVWMRLIDRPVGRDVLLTALALVTLGLAINALNIAYMAGSGWHMASLYHEGRAEMASLYEITHPIGLMAARFGNFLVALGALALGWAEWQDAERPRWLAALAWLAAAGGLAGVLFFNEASRLALGATALLSGWQLATGARALAVRRERTGLQ